LIRGSLGNIRQWAGFLQRPFLAPERVRAYQDARVRGLVDHAWRNVAFYRRRFEAAGIRPEEIGGGADLARLPILTKAELRACRDGEMLARGVDEASCTEEISSGTTGEPVRFVRTRGEEYTLFAHRLRAQVLSGLRPWDVRMKIGSKPVRTLPHRLGLFRCDAVSDGQPHTQILAELAKKRFDVLSAMPNILDILLPLMGESNLRGRKLRRVFCGAELLSPATRRRIEEALGCRVVDFYGATEVNLVAWECVRCGLYHTCDDAVYAEVIPEDGRQAGAGEEGRLVLTALHSFAMPLIRYEIGDVVRRPAAPRGCRIGFGVIDKIVGRVADHLPLPDGQWLGPGRLIEVAQSMEGVRRFRILQTSPVSLEVEVEREEGFCAEQAGRLRAGLEKLLPAGVRVEIREVDEMPLTAGGKLRIVEAWRGAREP
jgi:phenylacetate-CoA ligase